MTDGIPAVTTVLTTQLPLSLRDSPVMKTEDDYCRLGHARSLLSLETLFMNTWIQPALIGFTLVNAPRRPKGLPQTTTAWQHTAANLRRRTLC